MVKCGISCQVNIMIACNDNALPENKNKNHYLRTRQFAISYDTFQSFFKELLLIWQHSYHLNQYELFFYKQKCHGLIRVN